MRKRRKNSGSVIVVVLSLSAECVNLFGKVVAQCVNG